jgi:ABC-type multidrug transport system ATPase subunit
MNLRFESIEYSVAVRGGKRKQVLDNLSGTVSSGSFLAIMGPSGSGKTSLLNVLAGRVIASKGAELQGGVFVDGVSRSNAVQRASFLRRAAYVQQDDNMMAFETVEETLTFAAMLTLPQTVTKAKKLERVQTLINQLGLRKSANTIIGMSNGPVRGVSGGERKRVSIAVELLSDPDCLFCDEPTSGLDSFQALNVIQALKALVTSGRVVICSIHQPRSSIYNEFDKLCLLSEGRMVYYGQSGAAAVDYFRCAGFSCPSHFNPADYFMDTCSLDTRSEEQESASKQRLETLWGKHSNDKPGGSGVTITLNEYMTGVDHKLDGGNPLPLADVEAGLDSKANNDANTVKRKVYNTSWFQQFKLLLARSWRSIVRNKIGLMIRLVSNVVLSLILAAIYSETGGGQKSIQDRQGVLFFCTLNQSFGGMFGAVQTFGKEKSIIVRERFSKAYYVSAYYMARFITGLPGDIIFPAIAGIIIYFPAGLNPDPGRFVIFLATIGFVAFCAQAVGLCISAYLSDFEAASALAPPLLIVMMLFGGFYINADSLPEGARWVKYISMHYWGFGILVKNEFSGTSISCHDVHQLSEEMSKVTEGNATVACIRTGNEVLERMSLENYDIREGFLGLLALTLAMHFLAYICIRTNKPKLLSLTQEQRKKK